MLGWCFCDEGRFCSVFDIRACGSSGASVSGGQVCKHVDLYLCMFVSGKDGLL